MERDAIVYGTDRPRLLAGRTLLLTSGPTYDSVRAYGIWLPTKPLLVTVSGIATGNLAVAWEYPWREQTTAIWRNAIIRSAMSTRHNHRHGLKPGPGNGSPTEHRRPSDHRSALRPLRTGHASHLGLDGAGRSRQADGNNDLRTGTRRIDPDNGNQATSGAAS